MKIDSELVAFVFADRVGDGLRPMTDSTCVALLPVAGKPLIQYTLEDLAMAGIRDTVIFVSEHADKIEEQLGDGTRLGVRLSYALTRGQESPHELLWRYCDQSPKRFLAVRGDVLRSNCVAEFLDAARERSQPNVMGQISGGPCGLCLGTDMRILRHLDWLEVEPEPVPASAKVCLKNAAYSAIESPAAYYRANLMVVSGHFQGLELPGRPKREGLVVGPGSEVELESLRVGRAVVGERCRIHPDAELNGPVVIGDDVFIDRNATVTKSVIQSGTYVGVDVDVRHAIVDGDQITRIDHDVVHRVTDGFLLAEMKETSTRRISAAFHRSLGLLVLALSLPLWPIAAALSVRDTPSSPTRSIRMASNKREQGTGERTGVRHFTAWQWSTSVPVLRNLPLLLAVVAGHLRLVGIRPRAEASASLGGYRELSVPAESAAGLLGPAQIDVSPTAPEEELLLNEMHYARARSWLVDTGLILRGACTLVRARAWRPS
jgi:NDP-sugar pyrophosphorylase family protein